MTDFLRLCGVSEIYHRYIYALGILILGWYMINFIIKFAQTALKRAHVDEGAVSFTRSFLKLSLRTFLIIVILVVLGLVQVSSLVTAISAIAVTVGITMKNSLSNLASGFLVITNKIFSVGDKIKVKGDEGIVSKIEIMFTTLITDDGDEIIIPNSCLIEGNIKNYRIKKENAHGV